MGYDYQKEKPALLTDEGINTVIHCLNNVRRHTEEAGCCTAENAWKGLTGDSWMFLAALDWLVKNDRIRRVDQINTPAGQHQIFQYLK